MNFEKRSREYREFIEDYLKNIYTGFRVEPQTTLFDAMEYSLLAGCAAQIGKMPPPSPLQLK